MTSLLWEVREEGLEARATCSMTSWSTGSGQRTRQEPLTRNPLQFQVLQESCYGFDRGIRIFLGPATRSYHISTETSKPLPVVLVKMRNRALKFLVHFSLICQAKYPKPHEKWSPMGLGIWGSISHPSCMLWRPFRGRLCKFWNEKGFS